MVQILVFFILLCVTASAQTLSTTYGGTGVNNFSFSGTQHKVASVGFSNPASNKCLEADSNGNIQVTLSACSTSSGTVTSIATSTPIGGGTITTTGTITCTTCVVASSPGVGLAHFAGATQTVTSSAVVGADMTNNTVTATQLASQYSILRCYPGLGDGLNAISAGTYLQTNCYNNSGVTWTITRIGCFTDNAGSSTLSATNGAGTALLTGAVTCGTGAGGTAGTQSATTTIANGDVIKFTFIADGTSKQSGWFVSLTQ